MIEFSVYLFAQTTLMIHRRLSAQRRDIEWLFPLMNNRDIEWLFPLTNNRDIEWLFPLMNSRDIEWLFPLMKNRGVGDLEKFAL